MDDSEADRGSITLTWPYGRRNGPTFPPQVTSDPGTDKEAHGWSSEVGQRDGRRRSPIEGSLSFKTKGPGSKRRRGAGVKSYHVGFNLSSVI